MVDRSAPPPTSSAVVVAGRLLGVLAGRLLGVALDPELLLGPLQLGALAVQPSQIGEDRLLLPPGPFELAVQDSEGGAVVGLGQLPLQRTAPLGQQRGLAPRPLPHGLGPRH